MTTTLTATDRDGKTVLSSELEPRSLTLRQVSEIADVIGMNPFELCTKLYEGARDAQVKAEQVVV